MGLALRNYTLPLMLVGVAASAARADEPVKSSVAQKIDAIVGQVGDLSEFDEGLWENKQHREMLDHPAQYRPGIEAFLSASRDIPAEKVQVAVLALQCLPLDDYLSFVLKVSDLPHGRTGEKALFYSIIPGEEWSTRLAVDYKDQKVRVALEKAAQSPNATKKLKTIVKHMLDGSYAANIARSKDAPVLKCESEKGRIRSR